MSKTARVEIFHNRASTWTRSLFSMGLGFFLLIAPVTIATDRDPSTVLLAVIGLILIVWSPFMLLRLRRPGLIVTPDGIELSRSKRFAWSDIAGSEIRVTTKRGWPFVMPHGVVLLSKAPRRPTWLPFGKPYDLATIQLATYVPPFRDNERSALAFRTWLDELRHDLEAPAPDFLRTNQIQATTRVLARSSVITRTRRVF